MRQVEYAKCSMERKEEYRIITTIEAEESHRYVIKRAANLNAVPHVDRMLAYKFYEQQYGREKIRFTPCRKLENGMVEFDYIEGTLLDDILHQAITSMDWDKILEIIREVADILYHIPNRKPFAYSKEFTERYGEIPELIGMDAGEGLDIDLIAENIIDDQEGYWNVIDYEWTMNYAVPVKYIMFRFLYYQSRLKFIPAEYWNEVLRISDISDEEWVLFHAMDMKFFQSISQYSLSDLYQLFGRDVIEIDYHKLKEALITITIYDDQENLYHQKIVNGEHKLQLDVTDRDTIHVSFNAPNSILRMKLTDEYGQAFMPKAFNSVLRMGDEYYFLDAPLFLLDVTDYQKIELEIEYVTSNNPLVGRYVNVIQERDEAKTKLVTKWKRRIKQEFTRK